MLIRTVTGESKLTNATSNVASTLTIHRLQMYHPPAHLRQQQQLCLLRVYRISYSYDNICHVQRIGVCSLLDCFAHTLCINYQLLLLLIK